jgi:hypothetical protein
MPSRIERVASEVTGAVKAAKAKVKGLTGVFEQLTREHGEVSALLLRVRSSSDPKVREELFPTIRAELLTHEKGEVADVYSAFREHPELVDFADDHDTEALRLQTILGRLAEMDYADASWSGLFGELVELVTRHVKLEEDKYFPAASRIMGREESERLLEQYMATKQGAMQNLP